MKLVSYLIGTESRVGAVTDGTVVDLNRAYAALLSDQGAPAPQALADAYVPSDIVGLLAGGADARTRAQDALGHVAALDAGTARRGLLSSALEDVKLLPPVPRPPKIVCVARNYAEHAREAGLELPELPILFARFPATLVAPGDPVVCPAVSDQVDWEGELAVVIGRPGHRIARADAMDHVAGYSLFNDVTVRDYQFRVTQYTAGKNFSASGPFGPWLVLTDEIPDPHALELVTEVNGETMQRADTGDMIFDIPTVIEHISEFVHLEVGDVIATGTPAGVGFKRTPPVFLRPGDVVRVTIPEIGTLENPVVAEDGGSQR